MRSLPKPPQPAACASRAGSDVRSGALGLAISAAKRASKSAPEDTDASSQAFRKENPFYPFEIARLAEGKRSSAAPFLAALARVFGAKKRVLLAKRAAFRPQTRTAGLWFHSASSAERQRP